MRLWRRAEKNLPQRFDGFPSSVGLMMTFPRHHVFFSHLKNLLLPSSLPSNCFGSLEDSPIGFVRQLAVGQRIYAFVVYVRRTSSSKLEIR